MWIVDLRTTAELGEDSARLEALGNRLHLPVEAPDLPQEHLVQLKQLLLNRAPAEPVWVVCNSGNRAAWLWGLYQISEGTTPQTALAKVDRLATYPPIRIAILEGSHQLRPIDPAP